MLTDAELGGSLPGGGGATVEYPRVSFEVEQTQAYSFVPTQDQLQKQAVQVTSLQNLRGGKQLNVLCRQSGSDGTDWLLTYGGWIDAGTVTFLSEDGKSLIDQRVCGASPVSSRVVAGEL